MSLSAMNEFSLEFFSLKEKTAIVTGGGSGLGQAFSMALAKVGANLFIPGLGAEDSAFRELIMQQGVDVEFMQVDITEPGMPASVIAACKERFGGVDILVNNAGICKINKILHFGREAWDPMIATNLTAAFELSYEAAKLMIPQRSGKIINICSLYSYLGGQWSPAYATSKHALAGFTKAYCDELGQYNIQVNGIAPGYYPSQITREVYKNPKLKKQVINHIPAKRWGEKQDLMGAVIFLASRASDYVNGHLLVVDGGYLVR